MNINPDKIFLINLDRASDRLALFKNIPEIVRVPAVDGLSQQFSLTSIGFTLNPKRSLYKYLQNPCAQACYITHYNIWEHIIMNNIPWTLILEDDADPNDIIDYLHTYKKYNIPDNAELIFINKRMAAGKLGTEAYICNVTAAKKLKAGTNKTIHLPLDRFMSPASSKTKNIKKYTIPCVGLNDLHSRSYIRNSNK